MHKIRPLLALLLITLLGFSSYSNAFFGGKINGTKKKIWNERILNDIDQKWRNNTVALIKKYKLTIEQTEQLVGVGYDIRSRNQSVYGTYECLSEFTFEQCIAIKEAKNDIEKAGLSNQHFSMMDLVKWFKETNDLEATRQWIKALHNFTTEYSRHEPRLEKAKQWQELGVTANQLLTLTTTYKGKLLLPIYEAQKFAEHGFSIADAFAWYSEEIGSNSIGILKDAIDVGLTKEQILLSKKLQITPKNMMPVLSKVKSHCSVELEDLEKDVSNLSPYDVKGRCFLLTFKVVQTISQGKALARDINVSDTSGFAKRLGVRTDSNEIVHITALPNSSTRKGYSGTALVIGFDPFSYTSVGGVKQTVPSLKTLKIL